MATAMQATQALMPTPQIADRIYPLRWLLLIPALFMLHFGAVSALVAIGSEAEVTTQDNAWLSLADKISFSNPEVHAAIARYELSRGHITAAELQPARFEKSLEHWQRAAELRPYWPYYELGVYELKIRLRRPADEIRQQFDRVTTLAPNERGLDKTLLMLSAYVWFYLTSEQRQWVQDRLLISNYSTRQYVMKNSKDSPGFAALCAALPEKQMKQFCR